VTKDAPLVEVSEYLWLAERLADQSLDLLAMVTS